MVKPNEKDKKEARALIYNTITGGGRPHAESVELVAYKIAELREARRE